MCRAMTKTTSIIIKSNIHKLNMFMFFHFFRNFYDKSQ